MSRWLMCLFSFMVYVQFAAEILSCFLNHNCGLFSIFFYKTGIEIPEGLMLTSKEKNVESSQFQEKRRKRKLKCKSLQLYSIRRFLIKFLVKWFITPCILTRSFFFPSHFFLPSSSIKIAMVFGCQRNNINWNSHRTHRTTKWF